ncbi:helix-turn-helix domain-containing protein [Acidicapsa dinghuensis]|uniref:Helix-turn-helix domain-containing protein n=2 Tax=Acidicapsa dinghuensis TaxID=2218256 RepID=A0ABW1EHL2_9BACT
MERQLILSALQYTIGNRTRAAEILGISREGLRTKLQRFQAKASKLFILRSKSRIHPLRHYCALSDIPLQLAREPQSSINCLPKIVRSIQRSRHE